MAVYDNQKLFETLKEYDVISEIQLNDAYEESKSQNIPLGDIILERNLVSDSDLAKLIADLIGVPFKDLSEINIPKDILTIIPEEMAKNQDIIAFNIDDVNLYIATTNPGNKKVFELLEIKSGKKVKIYYSSKSGVRKSIALYAKDVSKAFDEIIAENVKQVKINKTAEPPIIKIVETIIDYAYRSAASDIHIEPLEENMLIRFRIDGVLHDIQKLPLELDKQIVTRIKVMANLRTDEHQDAQDGKIVYKVEGEDLDLRVSIAPITRGEKIVMRLLSERSRSFSLTDLGFSGSELERVEEAYHAPHGMILATGPTGSGKTTTLYAVLKLINKRDINIMTIEDPVEYEIDNVNQIQVNTKAELTFAKGLRSIVRQDPDVILVGEIRDEETASIAVNSAMTGHLVLSSLHTNDATTAFPRLIDMGVEPYLVATTVNIIIAQRLVRKICNSCKLSEDIDYASLDKDVKKYFDEKSKIRVYKGKGCSVCHNTGYIGRVGIYEVLVIDDEIADAVTAKKSAHELKAIAVKNGMRTMLEDGVGKVKSGITTIEELLRVTKD